MSLQQAAALSFPRNEALRIASLLAFIGGYLEAYTWIVHHVFAYTQAANVVFLWVSMIDGGWETAVRYIRPLLAFAVGVILACWLRRAAPDRVARISTLTEIAFLFIVALLYNRIPELAGTLGLPMVAAFQMVRFPRVEEWTDDSAMATGNFRRNIKGLFAALAGNQDVRSLPRPYAYGAIFAALATGAAVGAFATKIAQEYSLAVPIALLMIVLLLGEQKSVATRT